MRRASGHATYNIAIYGRNDAKTDSEKPFVIGLKDANGIKWLDDLAIPSWQNGNTGEKLLENVDIPAGASIVVKNIEEGNSITLDDIKVIKPAATE